MNNATPYRVTLNRAPMDAPLGTRITPHPSLRERWSMALRLSWIAPAFAAVFWLVGVVLP